MNKCLHTEDLQTHVIYLFLDTFKQIPNFKNRQTVFVTMSDDPETEHGDEAKSETGVEEVVKKEEDSAVVTNDSAAVERANADDDGAEARKTSKTEDDNAEPRRSSKAENDGVEVRRKSKIEEEAQDKTA